MGPSMWSVDCDGAQPTLVIAMRTINVGGGRVNGAIDLNLQAIYRSAFAAKLVRE